MIAKQGASNLPKKHIPTDPGVDSRRCRGRQWADPSEYLKDGYWRLNHRLALILLRCILYHLPYCYPSGSCDARGG